MELAPPRGAAPHRHEDFGDGAGPRMQNAAKETEAGGERGVRGVSGREHGLDLSSLVAGEVRVANGELLHPNRASFLMKSFWSKANVNDYPRVVKYCFHPTLFSNGLLAKLQCF